MAYTTIVLYQVKSNEALINWVELAAKIPDTKVVLLEKTNCTMSIPDKYIQKLEQLLQREYRSVRRMLPKEPYLRGARR